MNPEQMVALRRAARRELATRSMKEFVTQAWPHIEPETPLAWNWHLDGLALHLEAMQRKEVRQLLVNVPPGTMKSLFCSVFWPAFVWTTQPWRRFLAASYSEPLAFRDSVKCRDLIQSEWYQRNWPTKLRGDDNAKGKYTNHGGGWRMATSVEGRGTGEHPDFIIVDDPHNAREAISDAKREAAWDWWTGTMASRGVSRAVCHLVIMQRLHTKDFSGHIMNKGTFDHICLPMRFEPGRMKPTSLGWMDPRKTEGELLWPSLFPDKIVTGLEMEMGPYHAAGQLQQRPAPRGGGLFKREWMNLILPEPPRDLVSVIRYWDKAGTKDGTGAQTAGALVGRRTNGRFVILHIITGRWNAVEREEIIAATAIMDRKNYPGTVIWTEQEPGSGGKESAEATIINLAGFTVWADKVTKSKECRADPLACQFAAHNVEILAGPWTEEFIDEAEIFPNGRCKDQVDAAGGALNKLRVPTGEWDGAAVQAAGRPVVNFENNLEIPCCLDM